jgi:nondiscriminating glutamyl-tRNA synthetase
MSFGAEIVEMSDLFFRDEVNYDEEAKEVLAGEQVPEVLRAFLAEIDQLEEFKADSIKAAVKAVQKATGQKGQKLFMPVRAAATGQTHGPDLMLAMELIGKEKVSERVQKLLG